MRILIIGKKFPYPATDGETIVVYNYLKALHQLGHSFTFFCINTNKQHFKLNNLPDEMKTWGEYVLADIDTSITLSGAIKNLFTGKSYHVERFYSKAVADKLKALLKQQQFDVVQFETLYPSVYINLVRAHTNAKCIIRTHNVESEIWLKIADNTSNPLKKWYLSIQAKRLQAYEKRMLNQPDAIVPISEEDATKFKAMGTKVALQVLASGFDFSDYVPQSKQTKPMSLAFIGSMDWLPNQEGVKWLLKEVWPIVNAQMPELTLYIAGRNMPAWMQSNKLTNVEIIGEVADAKAFISSQSILLVPLLSGSGVRIKILEALALAKPVITTSLGLEGIRAENNQHLIIANSAKEFAQAIIQLSQNPELQKHIAKNGRELILKNYEINSLVSRIIRFYEQLTPSVETK